MCDAFRLEIHVWRRTWCSAVPKKGSSWRNTSRIHQRRQWWSLLLLVNSPSHCSSSVLWPHWSNSTSGLLLHLNLLMLSINTSRTGADSGWSAMHGRPRDFSRGGQIHRRSQDFLWGCTYFFPEKSSRLFLVVAPKTQANTTKWTTPPTLQICPAQQKMGGANSQNILQHFQGASAPPSLLMPAGAHAAMTQEPRNAFSHWPAYPSMTSIISIICTVSYRQTSPIYGLQIGDNNFIT